MVGPNERAHKLKEARDAQEKESNAAHELVELEEKMKRFEEEIQKANATIRETHNQAETFTREVKPLPYGSDLLEC